MKHIDLFSGIGGFALAVDAIWDNVEHIFCEIEPFCQALLKKRFERSMIFDDIKKFTADAYWNRLQEQGEKLKTSGDRQLSKATANSESRQPWKQAEQEGREDTCRRSIKIDILTGGFPCQPFSQAGKRRGTEDNRYLWPEMLRVIKDFSPRWVIAENVRGLVNISNGLVFQQVCLDLEGEGYEVQPFIIPAVAVNAPHRRDRVWFVAHSNDSRGRTSRCEIDRNGTTQVREELPLFKLGGQVVEDSGCKYGERAEKPGESSRQVYGEEDAVMLERPTSNAPDSTGERLEGEMRQEQPRDSRRLTSQNRRESDPWDANWLEVATELCGVDDGLSVELDGFKLSKSRHRVERLKALGNAIVPQVAEEIFKTIKFIDEIDDKTNCGGLDG